MIIQSDLTFDLQFEDTDDGCLCRVVNAPAGPAHALFTPPFTQHDLDSFGSESVNPLPCTRIQADPDDGAAEIQESRTASVRGGIPRMKFWTA